MNYVSLEGLSAGSLPDESHYSQTNICLRSDASRADMIVLRTTNFNWDKYQNVIVPRHEHSSPV